MRPRFFRVPRPCNALVVESHESGARGLVGGRYAAQLGVAVDEGEVQQFHTSRREPQDQSYDDQTVAWRPPEQTTARDVKLVPTRPQRRQPARGRALGR